MTYQVHEIFMTLQGEGYWTGRAAVFCRFSRCNLWTGLEKDRHRAVCQFCDTDFVDATAYTLDSLATAISHQWSSSAPDMLPPPGTRHGKRRQSMVVFTGGEPLLQLDQQLTTAMHERGYYIAVETNGTRPRPPGIDWLCMSPKAGTELAITKGDELKLVYPQQGINPANLLRNTSFHHYYLQPMDGPNREANTHFAINYILEHPQWRLSLQTHKIIGLP